MKTKFSIILALVVMIVMIVDMKIARHQARVAKVKAQLQVCSKLTTPEAIQQCIDKVRTDAGK